MTALQEAISVNPSSAVYRDTLGVVLLELGRPDMAIEHFKKAVRAGPDLRRCLLSPGHGLAEARRWTTRSPRTRSPLAPDADHPGVR